MIQLNTERKAHSCELFLSKNSELLSKQCKAKEAVSLFFFFFIKSIPQLENETS